MKPSRYLRDAAVFAPCYIALDWASYIAPLGPFNITPWNPQPALAIVWMLLSGLAHAPIGHAASYVARRNALVSGIVDGTTLAFSTRCMCAIACRAYAARTAATQSAGTQIA